MSKLVANLRGSAGRIAILPALITLLVGTPAPASAERSAADALDESRPVVVAERDAGGGDVAEANLGPHWCNATGALVDNIHRLGGESVMRVELGGGRTLERYWNVNEEVTIEHGADGNSCLVEMRNRSH